MYKHTTSGQVLTEAKASALFEKAWFEYQLKHKKLDGFYKSKEEYMATVGYDSTFRNWRYSFRSYKAIIEGSVYTLPVTCYARGGDVPNGRENGAPWRLIFPNVVCNFNHWARDSYNMTTGEVIIQWQNNHPWTDEQKAKTETQYKERYEKMIATPKKLGWSFGEVTMTYESHDAPWRLVVLDAAKLERFDTLKHAQQEIASRPLYFPVTC